MKFLTAILVCCIAFALVHTIQIGIIYKAVLIMDPSNTTINAASCDDCVCIMLNSTTNDSILSLNCQNNINTMVNCELFNSTTYRNSYFYKMENNSNSTFYFQQLPVSMEPEMTTEVPAITSIPDETTELFPTTVTYPCASLRWNTTGITLIANGTGSNQVKQPYGVSVFKGGNNVLYIVDTGNNRILRWNLATNNTTIVAGGQGSGRNATQLNNPTVLFVDTNENVYVADRNNYRVQFFANGSLFGRTIISNGTTNTPNHLIGSMFGMTVDLANNVYIAEYNFNRVLKVAPNSTNAMLVASNDNAGNSSTLLNIPTGIYIDSSTNILYIANQNSHCILKWLPGAWNGTVVAGICGISGSNETLLNKPKGLTFDKYGNMYVVDGINANSSRIIMFCPNSKTGIPIITSGLNVPQSIAVDVNLSLYVADFSNNRIAKYDLL